MTTVLDWAERYISQGLPVFPTQGKRPIPGISFLNATLKPSIVKAWFSSEQAKNWGIGIAIPSWLTIVDIENQDGMNLLKALDCDLPATIISGARGRHYWYKNTEDMPLFNRIKPIPDVDLLTNGGLVVPPSPHPDGYIYHWNTQFDINFIADAPEWVYTLANQHAKENAPKVELDKMIDGIPEGQRQVGLFRLACWLRGKGRTLAEAKIILKEIAQRSNYTEQDPSELAERVYRKYEANQPKQEELTHARVWSVKELVKERAGKIPMVLERFIPFRGLTIVVSDPKVGKSALVAQMVNSITNNTSLWGRYDVTTCGVLYLDLEQGEIPAANRWGQYVESGLSDHLYIVFEWPRMGKGGLEQLREFLYQNPHVRVVVIDTFADFKPEENGAGNIYYEESSILLEIKRFAHELDIAVVVVHHHSKGAHFLDKGNFMKKGSGSQAIGGKADAYISIDRELTNPEGEIMVGGKNIPTISLRLNYDGEKTKWDFVSESRF